MLQRLLRFNCLAFMKEGVIYLEELEQKCSNVNRKFEIFLAKELKLKQDNFYHSPTKPPNIHDNSKCLLFLWVPYRCNLLSKEGKIILGFFGYFYHYDKSKMRKKKVIL